MQYISMRSMRAKFNVDVRIKNEVTAIDRANKTVTVKRTDTGESYTENYDTLVISTGSSPLRPPIPGIDSPRIRTLWTVPDTDSIRRYIKDSSVKSAAVIGGGFIGLEMAENLRGLGLSVSIIEMLPQVMLAGLVKPDSGRVCAVSESGEKLKGSYVFQEPRLFPWYNVHDNLDFILKNVRDDGNRRFYSKEERSAMQTMRAGTPVSSDGSSI